MGSIALSKKKQHMQRIFTLLISVFCFVATSYGQDHFVYQQVMDAKNQQVLTEVIDLEINPRKSSNQKTGTPEIQFELAAHKLKKLSSAQNGYMEIALPGLQNQEFTVQLVKTEIFAPGFMVTIDEGGTQYELPVDHTKNQFYRGIVNGDERSLVALSFFEGGIRGFVRSSESGNLGITSNVDGLHTVSEIDQSALQELACGTADDGLGYPSEMLQAPKRTNKAVGDYVSIFIEVESDVVDAQGGISQAQAYIEDIFNQSAAIYANDGVDTRISEIEINTTEEYSTRRGKRFVKPTSSTTYLSRFQNAKSSSFNGDLAHLVAWNNVGGVAAGFSGICNSDRNQSMCISGFVSDYWFNVQLFAHEMGHLMGSRHTHACVWNGNNTAIDGCAGGTEGTCVTPPAVRGTIMSYCYNSNGLDFNEGFHPQPAAVIQNVIAQASCLVGGNGGPSCFDGVQNGDETGVDCGGSCPDCPTEPTCTDGIQNGDETGVDCGGSCTDCPTASCDVPVGLVVRNMKNRKGTGRAILDWADVSGATGYSVRIRAVGSSQWSNLNASGSSITVEGFSGGTQYEWEVGADCSGVSSNYAGCVFTYANRGSNVTCGASSGSADGQIFDLEESFVIFPNPVSTQLRIQIDNAQSEVYNVVLYNAVGQAVHNTRMTKNRSMIDLDVNSFEPGVYIVNIAHDSGNTIQKVIVQ